MTNDEALKTVRLLGAAYAFVCQGDVMWPMGSRGLSHETVNDALAIASSCVPCPAGWRVETVDVDGEAMLIEVRLEPATVLGLR